MEVAIGVKGWAEDGCGSDGCLELDIPMAESKTELVSPFCISVSGCREVGARGCVWLEVWVVGSR